MTIMMVQRRIMMTMVKITKLFGAKLFFYGNGHDANGELRMIMVVI